jgi:SAM-dependent methyltransferase
MGLTSTDWFRQNMKIAENESLHSTVAPTAPDYIKKRHGGGEANLNHLRSGIVNWYQITKAFEENGHEFKGGQNLLEFGCGGGRIIRHWDGYREGLNIFGADIDYQAIEWLSENLKGIFTVGPTSPPTNYVDEQFDAIYAFSVFSHLPEQRHLNWLAELKRITKPGATLVLTTMGRNCFDLYRTGKRPNSQPTPQMLEGKEMEWHEKGFLFFPYGKINFSTPENIEFGSKVDWNEYGSTFITDEYILSRWSKFFKVLEIRHKPDEWQDYVVLRNHAP